jgi:DNA-directed RNA polymerase specialized sigma24 family protein
MKPPRSLSQAELEAIEKLKQGYEPAWTQFIDALAPPLQRRLLKFTGGDQEKAEDYMSEIFTLIVQAIGKVT